MKLKIKSREEGRGKPDVQTFATLADAAQYIRDRWQGAEYCDGPDAFHTDYCAYTLHGFTLADIGKFTYDEFGRDFTFNSTPAPKPVCTAGGPRCMVDDCDGAHCAKCGGHFVDFYQTTFKHCAACTSAIEQAQRDIDGSNYEPRNAPGCDSNGYDLRAPFPHASDPHWSSPEADFARW